MEGKTRRERCVVLTDVSKGILVTNFPNKGDPRAKILMKISRSGILRVSHPSKIDLPNPTISFKEIIENRSSKDIGEDRGNNSGGLNIWRISHSSSS
jgi:hypothetical protein